MPLFDFGCPQGHTTEAIRPAECRAILCPACGGPAERAPAHRIAITAPSVDTRGMYRRFREASAEMEHGAERHERDTGQPAPDLGLWSAAKQQANAMVAAGEAPVIRKEQR